MRVAGYILTGMRKQRRRAHWRDPRSRRVTLLQPTGGQAGDMGSEGLTCLVGKFTIPQVH